MADYSKKTIPETNISIIDVKETLGESTYDLGKLCKSSKINPWSLYKPISCKNPANWPAGTDGNYGLTPKILSSASEVVDVYDGENNGWIYTPPSGGENSPYRLGDFCGYCHNAIKGVSISMPYGTTMYTEDNSIPVYLNIKPITTSQLSLSHIASLEELYIGVYVPTLNMVQTIKTAGYSGIIQIPKRPTAGTWEFYVILSTAAQSQLSGGNLIAAKYYSVPGEVKGTFTQLKSSWISVSIIFNKGQLLVLSEDTVVKFKNLSDRTRVYSKLIMYYTTSENVEAIENSNGQTSANTNKNIYRFDLITSSTYIASEETLTYTCSDLSGFPESITDGYYFLIYGESGQQLLKKRVVLISEVLPIT